MISVNECPICGNNSWNKHTSCLDHTVSHETFEIQRCISCSLLATNPRPSNDTLSKYYESKEYISHTDSASSFIDRIYKVARGFTLRWKESLIKKYTSSKTLLDYGCGTGDFLRHCSDRGWRVSGVEPAPTARAIASSKLKVEIQADISEIRNQTFDVVTLWHVLEHVPDTNVLLNNLNALLKEDGTLFIAVPNYKSYDGEKYKSHWAGYDVPRHLWHFSSDTLRNLVSKNGFQIAQIHPMRLDSFYVSLLSEKYLHNGNTTVTSYINAFLTGLKSNLAAKKTGNYSSLIYVIKKQHA